MDQQRDFEQEEILGDITHDGGDVLLFLNDLKEGLEGEEAGYDDQTMEGKVMIMMVAPATVMTAPVTERSRDQLLQSPARYIYILTLLSSFTWPSRSSNTSVKKRGPKKKLRPHERFTITKIALDGQPIKPLRTKEAFSAQCGVLVRA